MTMSRALLVLCACAAAQAADIVVFGDSWGAYGKESFVDLWKRKGSNNTVENIAISGTTSSQWVHQYTDRVVAAVSKPDVKLVWMTVGGNDVKDTLPWCALEGGSSDKCIQKVIDIIKPNYKTLLDVIKKANPKARVVAFGYDILGLGKDNGVLCHAIPRGLLPHCKGDATCFNEYFVKLGKSVTETGEAHPEVLDTLDLMGTIQAGAGVPGASIGHPNLAYYSPAKYMLSNCIHPNPAGYKILFDAFWDLYLHKYN